MGAGAKCEGADVERGSVSSDGRPSADLESVVGDAEEEKEMEKEGDVVV